MSARRNNRANGITGALICRRDMYIQLIEGPEDAIDALYQRIRDDDRHVEVTLEASATIEERMFPGWDMLADTNPSMTFSKLEMEDGAIGRADPDTLLAMFQKVAENARKDS